MNAEQTISLISSRMPELRQKFGVRTLGVFGSTVRGAARDNSDVDVLVDFEGPRNSANYFGLQFELEDLLGRDVDLVTTQALRAELRPRIEAELVSV